MSARLRMDHEPAPAQDTAARLRVLVVDDEPDVCTLLTAALQATNSAEVTTAQNAVDAVNALSLQDAPFDGIFLDIQMPGTTGTDLCAIIRSTPGYEDVPIIMLTAMTERRFVHDAYSKGADDYITKPFDFEEIRAKLGKERWQRRRRSHLKARQASYGTAPADTGREVINALEDAVLLPSVDRCVRRDAFQNYLLQARARPGDTLTLRAIKVAAIHDFFTRLSTSEYQTLMDDVARCVSELTQDTNDVVTHLGNGILLTACEGRSALDRDALHTRLAEIGVHDRMRSHDLTLRVILGEECEITQNGAADILFMVSRTIEDTERQEEKLSGWATFREWLSFSRSTGRERARIDQSAYQQILDDFISEGELGWK